MEEKDILDKIITGRVEPHIYAFSALLKPKSIQKSKNGEHKKFVNEEEVLELLETIDGSKKDEAELGTSKGLATDNVDD